MKAMYPDDQMIEAFGTVETNISERADHRNRLWCEWKEHSVIISPSLARKNIHYNVIKTLQSSGYKDPFDYQCRRNGNGSEIRFRDKMQVADFKITLAEARLSW